MGYLAIPTGQMILKYLGIGFLYLFGISTVIAGFVILNPGKDYKKHKVQAIFAWIWFISGFLFIISISLYYVEPVKPGYLRISGVVALITGIIDFIYSIIAMIACEVSAFD